MKTKLSYLVVALSVFALCTYSLVNAEEHHEGGRGGGNVVVRGPAPKFVAHAPGAHPHGRVVPAHSVRVLAPRVIVHGHGEFRHWAHPEFARPVYYWDWGSIHQVSCIAEDSYGDQYPVTENTSPGWGMNNMTSVEDDALDRCYQESGNDQNCYLATCSHF